ncbi:MAG TPA: aminotransferase class V-fold PLP-dependent enzyme [Chitinophagaceae bacterium]|jgi:selenocysteine lyase/cysteine desulfurase|nr:aminotransferase class V-fold PLP-dependent enzyme [Chitinophagaceae bacterium]
MDKGRKEFLIQLGSGLALATLPVIVNAAGSKITPVDPADFAGDGAPDDEKYWKQVARKYYDVAGDYINLENGYYGVQPKPVLDAFQKNIIKANREAARFARKEFPGLSSNIKKELAAFLEVSDEEIIITRNATEALNIAIQGYPFKEGDEVLLNQLDYFSMIEAFRMLEKRGKISVKAFDMPLLPATEDEIVDIYRKMITPKTRVILLTHVSNINGLIVPMAKISAMAREKGIDTITDSAHALGQVKFSLPALGSDFVGLNLHKWIGNPIGAGVLYIKKERIKEMQPLMGDVNTDDTNISKLAHFGTTPFAVIMTIPDSIAFHKMMGVERVSARLHYLKSIWINELKQNPAVEIVTPAGSTLSCAIASFRVKGKTAAEVADHLYKQHNILTVSRALGKDGCVRVTPAVYNSADDMRKLITAVQKFTGE